MIAVTPGKASSRYDDAPAVSAASVHEVMSLLNDFSQSLGCSTFPYTRTVDGPSINLQALKEVMDEAISLLESDAEEEKVDVDDLRDLFKTISAPQTFSATHTGGGSGWAPATHNHVYTPTPGQPSVGPGNSKLLKTIAKYAGWSDDLLENTNLSIISREDALTAIEMYIKTFGYNPAAFNFSVDVDKKLREVRVDEMYTGRLLTLSMSVLPNRGVIPKKEGRKAGKVLPFIARKGSASA